MIHPLDKVHFTQGFGENPSLYAKYGMKGHNGLDYRTKFIDTPLGRRYCAAAMAGTVSECGNQGDKGYGIYVRIEHPDGSQTLYAHLTKTYVKVGDQVREGQTIGLTGNTGASTAAHLHFGYRPPGWRKIYENGFCGYVDQSAMLPPVCKNCETPYQ